MILAALAVLAALDLENASRPREWKESFPVTARATLEVRTDDADVLVGTHRKPAVEVHVRHHRRTWGWVIRDRQPRVRLVREGDRIVVEALGGSTGVMMGGVVEDFSIEVLLPDSSNLDIRATDGDVTVSNVVGRTQVRTTDGSVELTRMRGEIEVQTTDGRILCPDVEGSVRAKSTDGRIFIEGRLEGLDATSSDGRIEVQAHKGSVLAEPWSVQTRDGSILFGLTRRLAALLDVSTRDGRVQMDLPITVPAGSRQKLFGELNGGRVPLKLRSGDGNIRMVVVD